MRFINALAEFFADVDLSASDEDLVVADGFETGDIDDRGNFHNPK
jgi:hypothetical protein